MSMFFKLHETSHHAHVRQFSLIILWRCKPISASIMSVHSKPTTMLFACPSHSTPAHQWTASLLISISTLQRFISYHYGILWCGESNKSKAEFLHIPNTLTLCPTKTNYIISFYSSLHTAFSHRITGSLSDWTVILVCHLFTSLYLIQIHNSCISFIMLLFHYRSLESKNHFSTNSLVHAVENARSSHSTSSPAVPYSEIFSLAKNQWTYWI